MADYIENQITLAAFEANGAKFNSKNLKRSYFDVLKNLGEYENGILVDKEDYNKIVLEAIIDKSAIDEFIELLKKNNFTLYPDKDLPFITNMRNRIKGYMETPKQQADLKSISKSIEELEQKPLYQVNTEEDAIFYFVPFNNKIKTLHDFFNVYKEMFYEFALKNDLTILFRTKDRKNRVEGFFAFNFLDSVDNKVQSYKYACRINLKDSAKNSEEFIEECYTLSAIGKNKFELEAINTVISEEK